MDYERILAYLPHYVAMLALVLVTVNLFRALVPGFGFWAELAVIAAVVVVYRPFVTWLGLAPAAWTDTE